MAYQIGANPFALVLAMTVAASTAFNTPVGYPTNLMMYGPEGTRSPILHGLVRHCRWL